mmetsp:Transcript_29091/g.49605  ORF Transcript_29091/g.49605 Transcript_29091/m.49605 type:complete len:226 (+) Transcript_29091:1959-2636(+)
MPQGLLQMVRPQMQLCLCVGIAPQDVLNGVEFGLECRHFGLVRIRPDQELAELLLQHDEMLRGALPEVPQRREDLLRPLVEHDVDVVPLRQEQRGKLGIDLALVLHHHRIVDLQCPLLMFTLLGRGWVLLVVLCRSICGRLDFIHALFDAFGVPCPLILQNHLLVVLAALLLHCVLYQHHYIRLQIIELAIPLDIQHDAIFLQPLLDALRLVVEHHQLLLQHRLV